MGVIGVLGACGARCCVEHVLPLVDALSRERPQASAGLHRADCLGRFHPTPGSGSRRCHALSRDFPRCTAAQRLAPIRCASLPSDSETTGISWSRSCEDRLQNGYRRDPRLRDTIEDRSANLLKSLPDVPMDDALRRQSSNSTHGCGRVESVTFELALLQADSARTR